MDEEFVTENGITIGKALLYGNVKQEEFKMRIRNFWSDKMQGENEEILEELFNSIRNDYFRTMDFLESIGKVPEVSEHVHCKELILIAKEIERLYCTLIIYKTLCFKE